MSKNVLLAIRVVATDPAAPASAPGGAGEAEQVPDRPAPPLVVYFRQAASTRSLISCHVGGFSPRPRQWSASWTTATSAQKPPVVSRERIRDRLWPGTLVSESTLATIVNEVPAALGDDPKRPRFIRTLRGHGYAFFGETVSGASEAPRPARRSVTLRLVMDDREVALHEGENLLGREEDAVL